MKSIHTYCYRYLALLFIHKYEYSKILLNWVDWQFSSRKSQHRKVTTTEQRLKTAELAQRQCQPTPRGVNLSFFFHQNTFEISTEMLHHFDPSVYVDLCCDVSLFVTLSVWQFDDSCAFFRVHTRQPSATTLNNTIWIVWKKQFQKYSAYDIQSFRSLLHIESYASTKQIISNRNFLSYIKMYR